MMSELTRSTLLVRLREGADGEAWRTFDRLYRPTIFAYARSRGLPVADAEDVAQQAMECVVRGIHAYAHQRPGSFRTWLRTITERRVQDHFRKRREQQAGTAVWDRQCARDASLSRLWDQQWRTELLRECACRVSQEVSAQVFQAFKAHALEGRPAEEVAAELGVSVSQVYVSKHRILKRIRQLLADLSAGDLPEIPL